MRKVFLILLLCTLWVGVINAQQFTSRQVTSYSAVGTGATLNLIGSGTTQNIISWHVSSGTVSGCSVKIEQSTTGVGSWSDLIAAQVCTSDGISIVTGGITNYIRVNLGTFTVATGAPIITVNYTGYAVDPTPYTTPPTVTSTNQLLVGGGVAWTSGLVFIVSPATYYIGGVQYASSQTTLTLSAADSTNPRIDLIAVDTSGAAVIIAGTPAPSPVAPSANPITQLTLTFVTVAANATTPSNIALTNVYLENTEWTCTTSGGTLNCASTSNPYAGSKDIEATAAIPTNYVNLANGSPITWSNYNSLIFYIRSKAGWPSNRSFTIGWTLSGKSVGSSVAITQGAYGFDSTQITSYQQVVIPTSAFGTISTADSVRFTISGKGSTGIGFYLDNISLQSGVSGPVLPSGLMTYLGAWNSSTTYNINAVVTSGGISYIATAINTNSTPPSGNWTALSSAGNPGTVTSVGTSGPLTGGPITGTGTLGCVTCAIGPGSSTASHIAEFSGSDGVTLKDGGAVPTVGPSPTAKGSIIGSPNCTTNCNQGVPASSPIFRIPTVTNAACGQGDIWPIPGYIRNVSVYNQVLAPSPSVITVGVDPSCLTAPVATWTDAKGGMLTSSNPIGGFVGNNGLDYWHIAQGAQPRFAFDLHGTSATGITLATITAEFISDSGLWTILANDIENAPSSGTFYAGPNNGAFNSATEGNFAFPIPAAGTLQYLMASASTAGTASTTDVFTVMKGTGSGASSPTSIVATAPITTQAVGVYRDLTDTASVAAGDWISFRSVVGSAGAPTIAQVRLGFNPNDGISTIIGGSFYQQNITTTTTNFWRFFGHNGGDVEVNESSTAPRAFTASNLYVYIGTQITAPHTVTLFLRQCPGGTSCADSAITCILNNASGTGAVPCDTTHTVAFAQGDAFSIRAVASATESGLGGFAMVAQ